MIVLLLLLYHHYYYYLACSQDFHTKNKYLSEFQNQYGKFCCNQLLKRNEICDTGVQYVIELLLTDCLLCRAVTNTVGH